MNVLGILTDSEHPELLADDQILIKALQDLGVVVKPIIWDESDWSDFSQILIRTPWDYSLKVSLFKEKVIDYTSKGGKLIHDQDIVLWNMDKAYMLELAKKGLSVIKTSILESFSLKDLDHLFTRYGKEIVLKPKVGAGGVDTFCLKEDEDATKVRKLEGRQVICQPFMKSVLSEGEYSFIFLNNIFSHCVVKKPRTGEFRVQDDYGGTVQAYQASKEDIKEIETFIKNLDFTPKYARVDVVKNQDLWALMELELIEPELFFRFAHQQSLSTFAQAIVAEMT